MTAKVLREILIEQKRDIKIDELPEVLEYFKIFIEFSEILKEEAFKKTMLKEIYGDRLYKLLCAIDHTTETGGEQE